MEAHCSCPYYYCSVTATAFVETKQQTPAPSTSSSFRTFLNLEHAQLVLTARDYVSQSNPPTSKAGFAVETSSGRQVVAPSEYMHVAQLLQPELVVPLADEIRCSFGNNRQRAAIQSSLDWLDTCIKHRDNDGTESKPAPAAANALHICGVILGGADARLRRLSAAETCRRDVQAVLISGLDSCESHETRNHLIDVVVDEVTAATGLVDTLPRLLSGIGEPLHVLDAVSRGIDAFVSPYPATLTKDGSALIFWLEEDTVDGSDERELERERSGSLLHLREPRFQKDSKPLLAGCDCFACKHYTRAYLHHLLNVREILGDILLYLHNLEQYYRFFRVIRREIKCGRFDEFAAKFRAKYDARESTAPPIAVPLAILERKEREEAEKLEQRARIVAEKAAKAKSKADAKRRENEATKTSLR